RGQDAAVGVAAVGVHDPVLAPSGANLQAFGVGFHDGEIQPLVERSARDELLELVHADAGVRFLAHVVCLWFLSRVPSATHCRSCFWSILLVPASGSCSTKKTRRGCWYAGPFFN